MTQSRITNIPTFMLFSFQADCIRDETTLAMADFFTLSLLMQYSSFFALGGSNAISSIDLSNAYNGVSGYNIIAVGLLTFISNWAGPIWWTCTTFSALSMKYPSRTGFPETRFSYFASSTVFATFTSLAVLSACLMLREHLFVWTVFSPKFLYTMAWTAGHHLLINGILGYAVFGS